MDAVKSRIFLSGPSTGLGSYCGAAGSHLFLDVLCDLGLLYHGRADRGVFFRTPPSRDPSSRATAAGEDLCNGEECVAR